MRIEFDKFMDLSKRQGKILICGEEGAGKTLLSTYIGVQKMLRGLEDCWKSFERVDEYNALGYHFSKNYEHLVFSNYDINCSDTHIPSFRSYVVDPFRIGLHCEDYYTDLFPAYSFFIITEGQIVFNSHKWANIRPEIRRYWETSRQADIELIVDTNQPNLVYNGIRGLFNRIFYLYQKTEPIYDKNNVCVGHKLFIKEFKRYQWFDQYMENHNENLVFQTYELILRKCMYENYDSKQCRYLHLKGRKDQDYTIEHFPEISTVEDVENFVDTFGMVDPDGYYISGNKNLNKNVKKVEDDIDDEW